MVVQQEKMSQSQRKQEQITATPHPRLRKAEEEVIIKSPEPRVGCTVWAGTKLPSNLSSYNKLWVNGIT